MAVRRTTLLLEELIDSRRDCPTHQKLLRFQFANLRKLAIFASPHAMWWARSFNRFSLKQLSYIVSAAMTLGGAYHVPILSFAKYRVVVCGVALAKQVRRAVMMAAHINFLPPLTALVL